MIVLLDLQTLADTIPEIASKIDLPDLKYMLEFFATRFARKDSLAGKKISDDVKVLANKLLDIRAIKE